MTKTTPKPRGFAALSPERRREIAASGGRALKPEQRSYSKNRDLAAASGAKGGKLVDPKNRSFSRDPELASSAGRKDGNASHRARKSQ